MKYIHSFKKETKSNRQKRKKHCPQTIIYSIPDIITFTKKITKPAYFLTFASKSLGKQTKEKRKKENQWGLIYLGLVTW